MYAMIVVRTLSLRVGHTVLSAKQNEMTPGKSVWLWPARKREEMWSEEGRVCRRLRVLSSRGGIDGFGSNDVTTVTSISPSSSVSASAQFWAELG